MRKIRPCPHCHDLSLIPNGVFWACGSCGLAITSAALSHVLDASTQDTPSHHDALGAAAVGD